MNPQRPFLAWFMPWFVVTCGFAWMVLFAADDRLSVIILLGILAFGSVTYWFRYWREGGSPFRAEDDESR